MADKKSKTAQAAETDPVVEPVVEVPPVVVPAIPTSKDLSRPHAAQPRLVRGTSFAQMKKLAPSMGRTLEQEAGKQYASIPEWSALLDRLISEPV